MSFSNFKNVKQVIQEYPLQLQQERFLPEVQLEVPEWFMENLNFALDKKTIFENEAFFVKVLSSHFYNRPGNGMVS